VTAARSGEPLLCLVGPTASGKSALALALARRLGAEIVSLDSMQVYRGMDIGTAKPSPEERALVRHHMLDVVGPEERYDVQRWLADVARVEADLATRGRRALFVGGTGFYLRSLLSGLFAGPPVDRELRARIEARARELGSSELHRELVARDPASSARIHPNDLKRVVRALEVLEQTGRRLSDWQQEWGWEAGLARPPERAHRIVGLELEVAELDRRIAARARAMLARGWAIEAAAIRAGPGFSASSIQALGYREALDLADGRLDVESAARSITLRTRQFARRQRTWYRKFESIRWLPAADEGAGGTLDRLVEDAARALA
jgi:tRNA dimethylallyltransferase